MRSSIQQNQKVKKLPNMPITELKLIKAGQRVKMLTEMFSGQLQTFKIKSLATIANGF